MPHRPISKARFHHKLGHMWANSLRLHQTEDRNFSDLRLSRAARGTTRFRVNNSRYLPHVGAKQLAKAANK